MASHANSYVWAMMMYKILKKQKTSDLKARFPNSVDESEITRKIVRGWAKEIRNSQVDAATDPLRTKNVLLTVSRCLSMAANARPWFASACTLLSAVTMRPEQGCSVLFACMEALRNTETHDEFKSGGTGIALPDPFHIEQDETEFTKCLKKVQDCDHEYKRNNSLIFLEQSVSSLHLEAIYWALQGECHVQMLHFRNRPG